MMKVVKVISKNDGFTLLEMIISLVIIGIIAIAFLSAFVTAYRQIHHAGNKSVTHYTSQDEMENIITDNSSGNGEHLLMTFSNAVGSSVLSSSYAVDVKGAAVQDSETFFTAFLPKNTTSASISSDATLAMISYGGTNVPGFSANRLSYNIILSSSETIVPVVAALKNDVNATVNIIQALNLTGTEVERTATINVTAEDGTTVKVYKVIFEKAVPGSASDATLNKLDISGCTLNPAFNRVVFNYTVKLPSSTGNNDLPQVRNNDVDTDNNGASIEITQQNKFNVSQLTATATITVTSKDKTTVLVYKVTFDRS